MSILNLPENFTVTAHSGCEGTSDNSMESIDKAFECGGDIFEVDVRFDKDGVPILTHDEPIGGELTLEDAFKKLAQYPGLRCNIDIKCTDNLKAIPLLAEKYRVSDRIFYTGINENFVDDVKKSTPEIPYYFNTDLLSPEEQSDEYFRLLVKKVKDCGAIGINCNHQNATAEMVEDFHKNNLLVSIWTCNEEADMIRILNITPDNITTRRPSLLRMIIKSLS